jgi:hypothetical protein
VCVSVYPPIVARQQLGLNPLIVARQLGKNPPIVARQRLGKISLSLLGNGSVEILLSFLGNDSVETLPRLPRRFQCGPCRIKASRRLVLPRTSCFNIIPLKSILVQF